MPPIHEYKCNKCDFELPTGWGSYMYVRSWWGRKVACPHPVETAIRDRVLGIRGWFMSTEEKNKRTGFNSYCVCLDCLKISKIDLEREKKECQKCKSKNIKAITDVKTCPKCKEGEIEWHDAGWS